MLKICRPIIIGLSCVYLGIVSFSALAGNAAFHALEKQVQSVANKSTSQIKQLNATLMQSLKSQQAANRKSLSSVQASLQQSIQSLQANVQSLNSALQAQIKQLQDNTNQKLGVLRTEITSLQSAVSGGASTAK